MGKRLLSCFTSDFNKMSGQDLKNAIKASEGRTVLSENIAGRRSVTGDVTNSELARAFGADLILLNGIDVYNPVIDALPESDEPIKLVKKLTGRPIGLNLEPVDLKADMMEEIEIIPEGRICSEATLKKIEKMGFDFVCLTGNPGTGVTNSQIAEGIKLAKKHFSGMVIAGKMHSAGVDEPVAAIMNKIAGVDIQHIGDAGYSGVANFENIMELSIAIRGVRHTVRMIAASNDR